MYKNIPWESEDDKASLGKNSTVSKSSFKLHNGYEETMIATIETFQPGEGHPTKEKSYALKTKEPARFGQDEDHCLCAVASPVFKLCQLFGFLPISVNRKEHKVYHSMKSFPTSLSVLSILFGAIGIFFWFPKFFGLLNSYYKGADFYPNMISLTVEVLAANILFFRSISAAKRFANGWNKLHDTINEIGVSNFKTLKYSTYIIPYLLIQEWVWSVAVLLVEASVNNWSFHDDVFEMRSSTFSIHFMLNLATLTFMFFCFIIARNFVELNKQLTLLKETHFNDMTAEIGLRTVKGHGLKELEKIIIFKLSNLRRLHENLCASARSLESSFGLQVLAVFLGTGVSFIVGVYMLVTSARRAEVEGVVGCLVFIIFYGMQSIYPGTRILAVVINSQMLMNHANEAGNILSDFHLDGASNEIKHEVERFHSKVGLFPLKITACGVHDLGSNVLSVAAGNVVTYVLVLMQFKMSDQTVIQQLIDGNKNSTVK